MKQIVLILCFCFLFSIIYIPLNPFYSITGQVYSEIKKPVVGTEKKPDCKECHNRSATMKGSAKPTAQDQGIRKGDGKLTPPPDHIRKDKRRKTGQQ